MQTRIAQHHVVTAEQAGQRVDHVLRQLGTDSRTTVTAWFRAGQVLVNNRHAVKGQILIAGDEVTRLEPDTHSLEGAELPSLDIRYQTERVLVLYKPPGVASISLKHSTMPALSSALIAAFPTLHDVGYHTAEAGLLQRLDNDTSGLLLAARDSASFQELLQGMRQGQLTKRYLALVTQAPTTPDGEICLGLAPHPKNRRKVTTVDPESRQASSAQAARTTFRVLATSPKASLLELQVKTAYRHQIRAHLAAIGSPLAGDALYGGDSVPGLSRHALHAVALAWSGSVNVPAFELRAELPADLVTAAASLGLNTTAQT